MPQTTVTVASGNVQGRVVERSLHGRRRPHARPDEEERSAHQSIIAIGSDGYTSIEVGGEIDPKFGNIKALVATSLNGMPLSSATGFARIGVPGDAAAGRYVSSIKSLQVGQL